MILKIKKKKIENKNKPRNETQDGKIRNSSAKYEVVPGVGGGGINRSQDLNHLPSYQLWDAGQII